MTDFGSDYVLGRIAVSFMKTAEFADKGIGELDFLPPEKNVVTNVDPGALGTVDTYPGAFNNRGVTPSTKNTLNTVTREATPAYGQSRAPVVQAQPAWGDMTYQERRDRKDQSSRDAAARSKRIREYNDNRNNRVTEAQQRKQPGVDAYNTYRKNNPVGPDGFRTDMTPEQKLRMGANLRANGALASGQGFRDVDAAAIQARVDDPRELYAPPEARQNAAVQDASTGAGIPGTKSSGLPSAIRMSGAMTPAESRNSQDQAPATPATTPATPATTPVATPYVPPNQGAPNALYPNNPVPQSAPATTQAAVPATTPAGTVAKASATPARSPPVTSGPLKTASAESRQIQDQAAPVATAPNGLNSKLPTQQGASATPMPPVQIGASTTPQLGAVARPPSAPSSPSAPVAPIAPAPAISDPSGTDFSEHPSGGALKTAALARLRKALSHAH